MIGNGQILNMHDSTTCADNTEFDDDVRCRGHASKRLHTGGMLKDVRILDQAW